MTPQPIPGYSITATLYDSAQSLVFRGVREDDRTPVIIKQLKAEYPTIEQLAQLRQEYLLPRSVDSDSILKPYALEPCGNSWALILEDFGARSLREHYRHDPVPFAAFLKIAIALTEALGIIHEQGIIHKDIKPSNILFNPRTGQVKLGDFSLAIALTQEQQNPTNPTLIQGTLAYMSPEQTGRMNRHIDYRTDFYSLGITFYELLSGALPFESNDPMELVHCHIAQSATPLHRIANTQPKGNRRMIPTILSEIVAKLMAKNAEDRYQSTAGLLFDLQQCQRSLEEDGQLSLFGIGQRDRETQLLIPQKLYGREAEIQQLMAAFERVAQPQGRSEWVLVAGYSGIGKTSIINEVHKPIVAARGNFIAGKFDQFTRDIPYAAFIQAFDDLIRELLTQSDQMLDHWREQLLAALGNNGILIADVIPDIELIIGQQPDVPSLDAMESQNRFKRVFRQFVQVFCQPEHPLVIFLDDLQWVDRASLKLIELLLTAEESQNLLLIGAYRDNEVDEVHPLMQAIAQLQTTPAPIETITVNALAADHVQQLVAETLVGAVDPVERAEFADLIFNKTQGNPFFITQLLQTLHQEKRLHYNARIDAWQWSLSEIQAIGITDLSILELMSRNLAKLPPATQRILQLAACVGSRFNLQVLATVTQTTAAEVARQLWEALRVGLILPLSANYQVPILLGSDEVNTLVDALQDVDVDYRFLHDRVQQAAYTLIPEADRQRTHLSIGQMLRSQLSDSECRDNIFALTRQLNFGLDLLTNPTEKYELAQFNLWAAQRAKRNTAYLAAENYLAIGLRLLTPDDWQRNYALTFALHREQVEIHYFNNHFAEAIEQADAALAFTQTVLDAVALQNIKIKVYVAQNELQAAVDLGLETLHSLEVELTEALPEQLDVAALATLPPMTDPHKIAAMDILVSIQPAVFILNTGLALPVVFTMIELSRTYGNTGISIYAYGMQGWLLCGPLNDIEQGYQFGNLAVGLLNSLNALELKAKTYANYAAAMLLWKAPLQETIPLLGEAVQSGLETGDLEFACHAAIFYGEHPLFAGEHLDAVMQRHQQQLAIITRCEQDYQLNYALITAQIIQHLRGPVYLPTELKGTEFDAEIMLPIFQEAGNINSVFYTLFGQVLVAYLFGDYQRAVQYVRQAWDYSAPVLALLVFNQFMFYGALALLAQHSSRPNDEFDPAIQTTLAEVEPYRDRLLRWASHAPGNFQHQVDLVEAEIARILGDQVTAMEAYSRAIAAAQEQGFAQVEALANERAGLFYRAWDCESMGRNYLIDAYYAYMRWGAIAKVEDLEGRYPEIFSEIREQQDQTQQAVNAQTTVSLRTTTSDSSGLLDLPAAIAASQAIAEAIGLEQLFQTLLKIIMENTGAQTCVLLLHQSDVASAEISDWLIQGLGQVDPHHVSVLQAMPLEDSDLLPLGVVQSVIRRQETVLLNNACVEGDFVRDPYILEHSVRSVLCIPMVFKGQLKGVVYLENNLTPRVFTRDRLTLINLLTTQAAISIENAQLYERVEHYTQTLEAQVAERTQELALKNKQLKAEIQRRKAIETALQNANAQLNRLANLDGLTQVANRRSFDAYWLSVWQQSQEQQTDLAVILIDVDCFKLYNDHYGHQAGDRALQQVAQTLEQMIQHPNVQVSRYGGEEFAVILPDADLTTTVAIAKDIQSAIYDLEITHAVSTVSDRLTLSMGICSDQPMPEQAPQTFIQRVDKALYEAKQQGRDHYCYANGDEEQNTCEGDR